MTLLKNQAKERQKSLEELELKLSNIEILLQKEKSLSKEKSLLLKKETNNYLTLETLYNELLLEHGVNKKSLEDLKISITKLEKEYQATKKSLGRWKKATLIVTVVAIIEGVFIYFFVKESI